MRLAFCWAHMRRPFYEFFTATQSPLAADVLARIRELYAIEAEIRGHPAEHRRQVRHDRSRPRLCENSFPAECWLDVV